MLSHILILKRVWSLNHQTDQWCRLMKVYDVFTQIGKYDRTSHLQLVRRQLECEKVRLRHDIDGGGTVFAVGKKHGRQREVWHGTKLSQASLPPPRPPCLAGPETFGDIELRPGFSCLLSKRDATCNFDQLALPKHLRRFFGRPPIIAGEFARACNLPCISPQTIS